MNKDGTIEINGTTIKISGEKVVDIDSKLIDLN